MKKEAAQAHLLGSTVLIALLIFKSPRERAQAKAASSGGGSDLEAIIVTASRLAAVARLEQKDAANLINVQSSEDMAKYPDFDAAEALGRIPGLTMAGDTGEIQFISIRTMDGNFNGSTFGGVT